MYLRRQGALTTTQRPISQLRAVITRPSDEDFQLLIRTVWFLHRCNFLNFVSEQFCCSIFFSFFWSDVSIWSLSAYVAELGDSSSPLPLPTLLLLSHTFSWPLLFSFFPSLLPSFHKLPPSPPAKHLSLIHISEPTRLLSISYAVFCLKKKK